MLQIHQQYTQSGCYLQLEQLQNFSSSFTDKVVPKKMLQVVQV